MTAASIGTPVTPAPRIMQQVTCDSIQQRIAEWTGKSPFDSNTSDCRTKPLLQLSDSFAMQNALQRKSYWPVITTGWPTKQILSPEELSRRCKEMMQHSVIGLSYDADGNCASTVTAVVEPTPDGGVRLRLENLTTRDDVQNKGYARLAVGNLLENIEKQGDFPITYAGGTSLQPHANGFYRRCGLVSSGIEFGLDLKPGGDTPFKVAGMKALDPRFELRIAEDTDFFKGFASLLEHGFHPEGLGIITPEIFSAFLQRCGTFKTTYVIEDQHTGRLVATGSYFNETKLTEGDGKPTGRISSLAFHPDYTDDQLELHIFAALHKEAQERNARCILSHGIASQKNLFKNLFGMTDRTLELGVFVSTVAQQSWRAHRKELEAQTWKMFLFYYALGVYNSIIFFNTNVVKSCSKRLWWSSSHEGEPVRI